ncbi:hypothetical protein GN330_07035 [Nitratireductor sp. CAU 1489]|uniref:DUF4383 domain-containing protein n=1 Tax=Nitratireductor arenosus TaxID=2682096 RepID=A0A844QG69_9HYPH|nr:hypothetical protein [Nitratireductor arenosus]MVA97000.1 hypothetical protein [Nitratireductor arenosus]
MTLIQKLGIAYAVMFFAVVGIGYVPAFNDANGSLFGLFSLQWYDDLLHGFSGVWALAAAIVSHRAAVLYFRLFGSVYFFDGVLGLVTGSGCLDGGIFLDGFRSFDDIELPTRFFANLPHLAIGGIAILIGFWLAGRVRAAPGPA